MKSSTKEINGTKYKLLLMTPMEQITFSVKAAKHLAPILKDAGELKGFIGGDKTELIEKILPKLSDALGSIDTEALCSLAEKAILGNLFAGNKKINDSDDFNQHLEENIENAFQLYIWAVKENAGVFFTKKLKELSDSAEGDKAE